MSSKPKIELLPGWLEVEPVDVEYDYKTTFCWLVLSTSPDDEKFLKHLVLIDNDAVSTVGSSYYCNHSDVIAIVKQTKNRNKNNTHQGKR